MNSKKKIILILTEIIFFLITIRFYYIRVIKHDYYLEKYNNKTTILLYEQAKRGRILDTNNNVLVESVAVPTINYRKENNISVKEEIELAYQIAYILELTKEATDIELKNFYLLTNDTDYLLTKEEQEKVFYRNITNQEINNIKFNRIDDEIRKYSIKDRIAIETYYEMNRGYKYETKNLIDKASNNICAKVIELGLKSLTCDSTYIRQNNYDTLKTIIGSVGNITKETLNYYLTLGYKPEFSVGITGLENYYESILAGTPATYKVNSDNTLTKVSDAINGNDLVLSINVDIQKKVEEIVKNNLILAKDFKNTKYYNTSYAIVSDPKTGQIIAATGLSLLNDNNNTYIKEVTSNIALSSFTVGSVVKGASHTVGYLNNAIDIGKKITDSCVNLYNVPEKCSYKRLGLIDDITALKTSSNYFQFITAIKTTNNIYKSNMKLNVTQGDFDRYRSVFRKYGLGSRTYIDLPKENIGITGSTIAPDLLLNLAIGEYDTYTPLQLLSYINTIANNGTRLALSFKKQDNNIVDNINLDQELFKRIIEGLYQVVNYGTGRGYTNKIYNPVGKTGTSEVYYDKDITSITQTYIGYAPRNDPKYSYVVMSPNISYNNTKDNYIAPINRYISRQISDFLFANY